MRKITLFGCLVSLLFAVSCTQLHRPESDQFKILEQGEQGESDTGLGTDPFTTGGKFTKDNANAMNNAINGNATDITTLQGYWAVIHALNGFVICDGNGTCIALTIPLGPAYGGTGANTSSMNGVPLMTNGVISAITLSSDYVLGNLGAGPAEVAIQHDFSSPPGDHSTVASLDAIKTYVDASSGGWNPTPLTGAPGSPVTGKVYVADQDNWDPCTSDSTTDYLVMYNGTVYLPLWRVDGTPIVQTAAPGTPVAGWFYWADADGTWDPDTEVTGTDPYQVYYNGSSYVTTKKYDGTLLSSTQLTKCTTIAGATADSDYMVEQLPYAVTIKSARVTQRGATNVVGHFDECDSAGASCAGIDGATDITATTTATDDGTLSNPTIDANDVIQWHTTSVSGTNMDTIVCINYTIDN